MSMTKRWLEDLSVKMGLGGEITEEVMQKAEDIQAHAHELAEGDR
jgi:hypothetical protein